jgi:hypothetical protein
MQTDVTGKPKVAVILLNWNSWEDTVDCLESLLRVEYPDFYPVVVDNASSDESIDKIRLWAQRGSVPLEELTAAENSSFRGDTSGICENKDGLRKVALIRSEQNLGFCAGNNLGLEFADQNGADYFLVLNNDTIATRDLLNELVSAAESSAPVGLVGGVICYAEEPDTIWWAGGTFDYFLNTKRRYDRQPLSHLQEDHVFESEWISGCMMLIPKSVYRTVGGYDEQFFIWSEEWDLSIRVKNAGYRLVVAPRARVFHKVGRALGVMSPLSYYYGIRNAMLLKKKHLSFLPRSIYWCYFLPNRMLRYLQFAIQGRKDLSIAGARAVGDYFFSRTGKWRHQS